MCTARYLDAGYLPARQPLAPAPPAPGTADPVTPQVAAIAFPGTAAANVATPVNGVAGASGAGTAVPAADGTAGPGEGNREAGGSSCGALAMLVGRQRSYVVRRAAVSVGRSSKSKGDVDVDLAAEPQVRGG